jgi:hypothetical protein
LAQESHLDENELRSQLIRQLQDSLAMSHEMMTNPKLDPGSRERWAQLHANVARVLNHILKDHQTKELERRLRELEAAGRLPRKIP